MWNTEMVRIVRRMLVDYTQPYKYSDEDLQELILVGAQLMRSDLPDLVNGYTIDVDDGLLSPDPTEEPRDDSFVNLACLRSVCIVDKGEARKAAEEAGLQVSDMGGFQLRKDGTSVQAKLALLKEGGWCYAYDDAKYDYLLGNVLTAGAVIVGAFKMPYQDSVYIQRYR